VNDSLPAGHIGGFRSIERDTDPTRLSPDNVTMVMLCNVSITKSNESGMPILAFDLEICAFARHFAD
jgi:hypothetical protein